MGALKSNPSQRCYEDIGMYPHPLKCPTEHYNMWTPFAMELIHEYEDKPNKRDFILNHIKIICGNDPHVTDYYIKWIAQMIQYPAIKTICPTFISKQGAGKSQIVYTMMSGMLGESKVFETTDPSRDVWGQFNGQMANSFLE